MVDLKMYAIFDHQYFHQFWNPQAELILLKLTLVDKFDQELAEILAVKREGLIFELTSFL